MNAATIGRGRVARLRITRCVNVALVVLGVYVSWSAAYLATGHDARDFIRIGTYFIAKGDGRSREIHLDPGYRPPLNQNTATPGLGYDGQFSYYIALDPVHARYYMDVPSLRYTRILYPILARALAFEHRAVIPWALLMINLLAASGGTWALAAWLRRRGVSPWWALIYGLWPGTFVAVQRDLTEPLGYGLALAGLVVLDARWHWRLPAAALVSGLAGLARQTTLVFPLVYGSWLAIRSVVSDSPSLDRIPRLRSALVFVGLSFVPYVAYWVFLRFWLGTSSNAGDLTPLPFGGLIHGPYRASRQGIDLAFVVLPAFAALAALAPRRRTSDPTRWLPWSLLLANVLLNIVFVAQFYAVTYTSASRYAIGIVISALLCLPYVGDLDLRRRQLLLGTTALAMIMLPVVAIYGFTNVST